MWNANTAQLIRGHFLVDPITREVAGQTGKAKLMQL